MNRATGGTGSAFTAALGHDRAPGAPPRLSRNAQPILQFRHLSPFAEHMLVHENAVVMIRDDMPLDRAALIGCRGVGLSAINGAAIAGAGRIIAVDKIKSKLELARRFGATDVVDASAGDPVEQVKQLTGGAGVHYSFEAIGLKVAAEQAWSMLRPGGTATIIGMIPFGQKIELNGFEFLSERKIQGSMMGGNRFRIDMPRYIDFYFAGKLHLDELISARLKLSEINAGLEALHKGEVARQVIAFGG
jgi:S-(hydroxymethyl)glutathione dehydrogenase/alcohol dehydrogenase